MNNPIELFNELESFNVHDQECAKQKFAEAFASTKESWIVNGMIDYYAQTNSFRIVEVLVKVQTPHDINIFNKLQKCLQESNPKQKTVALTLFAHIVRKHPTWLHKVVNHGFLKDLLKFLRYERDVITLISGLLCIISLLPIIPTSISSYLPDLFEIFNYVATLTCQQLNLSECHLTYLQYGLYMLFNRLYGMYPCNFIDYIRNEYILKTEKTPIFNHTIRGLLDTVKIHPNLIISTKSSETTTSRFKKMEPHDVVVECAKYSVDNEKSVSNGSSASGFLDCSHMKPLEYTHTVVEPLPALPSRNYLASAKSVENKFESLWSPSFVIQATPPPTANLPNTPTPTPNFLIKQNAQAFNDVEESTKLVEPGVEATPETTPIKPEIRNSFKPYPNSSQTARNIWPKATTSSVTQTTSTRNISTPSSPMRKEFKPLQSQLPSFDFASNQKLMRILSDREHSGADMMISKEDQEVNDINSFNTNNNSDLDGINVASMMEFEESDTDETDTTPPLYPQVNYVGRVKRLRLYSHCICSAGTSPADSINYMPRIPRTSRMKRYNSWPNLKSADVIIKSSKLNKQNESEHQSSSDEAVSAVSHFKKKTIQNGDTKMRNGSIFKKIKEDLKSKPLEVVQKASTGTQTIEYWPSAYEAMFYNIFEKEMKKKPEKDEIITVTQTTTTITKASIEAGSHQSGGFFTSVSSPNEMIDQYIQTSLKRKNSNDYRDQIELLAIQLQFEKHRREIHAERNRRLLGKSRQMRGLEQNNLTLTSQVAHLTNEIQELNKKSTETKSIYQMNLKQLEDRISFLSKKFCEENEKQKQIQREKDALQVLLDDEIAQKKQALLKIDKLCAENFDLKHLYEDAKTEAERGKQYRDQLKKLESDLIIFNEARLKCQQQMEDLNAMKARDIETDYIVESYTHELQDMKRILDFKSSQIDGLNRRIVDYEQQIQKKDTNLADQKRLVKSIKDVYEEKFKALEDKYATQKAIILKMEENALELNRNQQAIVSPESERTVDLLGYTSPLSISLASSNELSVSLRSTTELRSLILPEPVQQPILQRQQSIHDDMPVSSSGIAHGSGQPITYKKKS
ncbi:hypothetical protein ACKWTF_011588 [Chironomus riparius]